MPAPATFSESRRQLVHMAIGGFALLLRYLTWAQAAGLAAVAVAFNLWVLPRIAPNLYRPADAQRGFAAGIVFYPLSVLLLILALPYRLDLAAAVWGVLAFGDGAATLVGSRVNGPRWPWNREKTIAGTAAFVVAGAAAAAGLMWWTSRSLPAPTSPLFIIVASTLAAIVAALFETAPIRLDDNLSVPFVAGATLWCVSLVTADAAAAHGPQMLRAAAPAVIVNVAVAMLALRIRTVSRSGAIVGAAIGMAVYVGAGLAGWLLLVAAFVAAAATSRVGLARKALLGIEEGHGGRRGSGNALANCGVAAVAALLAGLTPYQEAALLAFVAALTTGASDTAASEIGKAFGRGTYLLPFLTPAAPGASGAISLEGTAAGVASAATMAAAAAALQLITPTAIWIVTLAATIGSLVESVLGARFEATGILNNDMLNLINTIVGAVAALMLVRLL